MDELRNYKCIIQALPEDEGGGYLASFPELPLVAGDGPTPGEALASGLDALKCAIEALRELGRPVPQPGQASGKMALRLPKSLHARLMDRAEAEGVSVNTTAVTLIAEGLGRPVVSARVVAEGVFGGEVRVSTPGGGTITIRESDVRQACDPPLPTRDNASTVGISQKYPHG